MRTTITVADDVLAEMERLRRTEGLGPSEALYLLARRVISVGAHCVDYVHHSRELGIRVDVMNIGEVLDMLDATS
ncbi:MAG: hypothetical protein VB036_17165 [Propionicimonas sp.]|nr:hypothetical protein [Propionicimonas sp.]